MTLSDELESKPRKGPSCNKPNRFVMYISVLENKILKSSGMLLLKCILTLCCAAECRSEEREWEPNFCLSSSMKQFFIILHDSSMSLEFSCVCAADHRTLYLKSHGNENSSLPFCQFCIVGSIEILYTYDVVLFPQQNFDPCKICQLEIEGTFSSYTDHKGKMSWELATLLKPTWFLIK